jgi:LCCL domain-containing protein
MNDDPELYTPDELPEDARAAVADAERTVAAVRDQAARLTADVRERAEQECAAIRERADAEAAAIQLEATRELTPVLRGLFDTLRGLQETYARAGKLDEALTIRARVRQLRGDLLNVQSAPDSLAGYDGAEPGRTLTFEMTGRADGVVWGTDVYTADSRLASAAVHAGVLRVGERAVVRVSLLDGADQYFEGTERHGVQSNDYPAFPLAFRVERA